MSWITRAGAHGHPAHSPLVLRDRLSHPSSQWSSRRQQPRSSKFSSKKPQLNHSSKRLQLNHSSKRLQLSHSSKRPLPSHSSRKLLLKNSQLSSSQPSLHHRQLLQVKPTPFRAVTP